MLTKDQKLEQSSALRAAFEDIQSVFLLENRGLTVNEVNDLRSKVRKSNGNYKVVKNSVVRLAIDGTGMADLKEHLVGPKALAWTTEDPVILAKVLRDFIKTHPALSIHEAYLEGHILEAGQAQQLADMPSRNELISKLLYMLQSPIRRLAVALNGPVQNLASVLSQVADQKTNE
jgi:large subunit ribosomal protein L10